MLICLDQATATKDELTDNGTKALASLYGGNPKTYQREIVENDQMTAHKKLKRMNRVAVAGFPPRATGGLI